MLPTVGIYLAQLQIVTRLQEYSSDPMKVRTPHLYSTSQQRAITEIPICQRHQALSIAIRASSFSDADRLDCVRMLTCNLDGFDPHFAVRDARAALLDFLVAPCGRLCFFVHWDACDTEG